MPKRTAGPPAAVPDPELAEVEGEAVPPMFRREYLLRVGGPSKTPEQLIADLRARLERLRVAGHPLTGLPVPPEVLASYERRLCDLETWRDGGGVISPSYVPADRLHPENLHILAEWVRRHNERVAAELLEKFREELSSYADVDAGVEDASEPQEWAEWETLIRRRSKRASSEARRVDHVHNGGRPPRPERDRARKMLEKRLGAPPWSPEEWRKQTAAVAERIGTPTRYVRQAAPLDGKWLEAVKG